MNRARLLVGLVASVACLVLAAPAAADFTVNNAGDGSDALIDGVCEATSSAGDCTLRAAIEESNSTPAADAIGFDPVGIGPISPASTLVVTAPVTIDGNGSSGPGLNAVDGGDLVQLFTVTSSASPTTFRDIRLEDGLGDRLSGGGGAIRTDASTELDSVVVTSSGAVAVGGASAHGAGVFSAASGATLTISDSAITNNTLTLAAGLSGAGGGLSSAGPLSLTDTTISGNSIVGATESLAAQGGGVVASDALTVVRSTISGNNVSGPGSEGAGIFSGSNPGARSITNSTISGNTGTATGAGGVQLGASASLTNVTFSGNTGLPGADLVASNGATVTARNTIFGSTGACGTQSAATIVSATPGNNIDSGTSCGFGTAEGNLNSTDPMLEPLALNPPGTTQTHALPSGSPAIDAAEASCGGLTVDQRGFPRADGGPVCDIGSYERPHRTVTASVAGGAGTGTVTAAEISCPSDCSQSLVDGATLVLTATPAAGSDFTSWSGCDSASGGQCTVTLAGSSRLVTASFALEPPPPGGSSPPPPPPAKKKKKKCKKGKKLKQGKCVKKKPKKKG